MTNSSGKISFLVTGGAGFIGSHIAERLVKDGHDVIVVDDLSTGQKKNVPSGAIFYQLDLNDQSELKSILEKHSIDYVIHQAAKINLNVKLEDPYKDVQSSVLNTLNILQCCVDHQVKKLVYASSVAVYGRPEHLPAKEEDLPKPVYSYGVVKKCAEDYVRYFSDVHGLDYSILRYANVYGPRQPIFGEVGVIAIYTDRLIKGEPFIIFGDGEHLRDYIYVDDVTDVTLAMIDKGDGETFNVGCGRGISVNEVYAAFNEVAGCKIPCDHKPERVGELGKFYCDTTKLNALLKNRSYVALKDGITRTLSYYGASV